MKQLVYKYDSRVRFTVPDATLDGDYITFNLPTAIGNTPCVWSAERWSIAELTEERKGEHPALLAWLRETLAARNYTTKGVSLSCGRCYTWLSQILGGKYRIGQKNELVLEEALGLKRGAIARKRREVEQI